LLANRDMESRQSAFEIGRAEVKLLLKFQGVPLVPYARKKWGRRLPQTGGPN